MLGKIAASKFAEVQNSRVVVSARSFNFCVKSPKVDFFSLDADSCLKSFFVGVYAFVSIFSLLLWPICAVLGLSTRSEIFFAIVQSIAVLVIVTLSVSHYFAVHVDLAKSSVRKNLFSYRVESLTALALLREPVKLHKSLVMFGVDNSIHALRQRNDFDRLVTWLFDVVTLYVVFHRSSVEEDVQRSIAHLYFTPPEVNYGLR